VSPGTTSAVLSVYLPNPGAITTGLSSFYCNCSSLTYQLWDVTTPVALVQADNSGAISIYNDLGSGTLYGSVVVTPGEQGTQILINLDAAAIASINAAAANGQEWAIGGSIFGAASTPEPGTISMVLTGLGAGLGMLRRRKLI
jgi:PEP-CTERM motif-containing protein